MKGGLALENWLGRTALLLGEEAMERLRGSTVAIIGLGGVGGSSAEAVARMGVGRLILVDNDSVDVTNINRQLLATQRSIGKSKCEAAGERLGSINPAAELVLMKEFYLPDNSDFLFDQKPDLILDAIDTVSAKLDLAVQCRERGIPLMSCLGTGNRLDPSQLRWGEISATAGTGCPLARVMRRELKRRGITDQTVVYSVEPPVPGLSCGNGEHGRHSPASCAFVPPAAGYLLASRGVITLLAK